MKKLFLSIIALGFSSALFAVPVFQPVNDFPSYDPYTLTSGYSSCRYDQVGDLATVTYPSLSMKLTRNPGKQRISSFDCGVTIDNSRVLKDVVLTGASSASFTNLMTAPECTFIAHLGTSSVSFPMDAIYVIPSGVISQYIVEDVDALLAGAKVRNARIQCNALDGVSWIRIDSVGPSYY